MKWLILFLISTSIHAATYPRGIPKYDVSQNEEHKFNSAFLFDEKCVLASVFEEKKLITTLNTYNVIDSVFEEKKAIVDTFFEDYECDY